MIFKTTSTTDKKNYQQPDIKVILKFVVDFFLAIEKLIRNDYISTNNI